MKMRELNLNAETVMSQIQNKDAYNFDATMNTQDLRLVRKWKENKEVEILYEAGHTDLHPKHFEVAYERWAIGQLLTRFHFPLRTFDRCSAKLKRDVFQEFVVEKKKELLFRFAAEAPREDVIGKTPLRVRAVLSNGYGIVNDSWLFKRATKILKNQGIEYYKSFEWDDHMTRLFVEYPGHQATNGPVDYRAGLLISNSETGHSSVWIEPVAFMNGWAFMNRRSLAGQGVKTRIVHRGVVDESRIDPLITQAREIAQVGIIQLHEARETYVPAPKILQDFKKLDVLPKRMYDILSEDWKDSSEISRLEAATKLVKLAQQLPLFQRTPIEQAAGTYTGLFRNYKSRINHMMEEING